MISKKNKKIAVLVFVLLGGIGYLYLVSYISQNSKNTPEWIYIGQNKEGDSIYYYKDIQKVKGSGSVFRVWIKLIFTKEESISTGILSILDPVQTKLILKENPKIKIVKTAEEKELLKIDCENRTFELLEVIWYDKKGNVIFFLKIPSPPEESIIVPDTQFEQIYKVICKKVIKHKK